MKKLMIAAAIVCAAAFVQAADFRWSVDNLSDPVDPANLYLAQGSLGRIFTTQDIAIETLSAQLAKGDFSSWESKGMHERAVSDAEGNISLGSGYSSKTAGTYDWYFAVINADATADATYFFVSDSQSAGIVDGAGNETNILFGNYEDKSYGTWTAISSGPGPVPEPTSGLLLLLGVAGLALRRRRA